MLIDDIPGAILNDNKVMAVGTCQVTSDFLVNPANVPLRYAFKRLIPQGNAFLLVECFDNDAVDLFLNDARFDTQGGRIHGYSGIDSADNHSDRQPHKNRSDPQRKFAISSVCQSYSLVLDRNFACSRFAGR